MLLGRLYIKAAVLFKEMSDFSILICAATLIHSNFNLRKWREASLVLIYENLNHGRSTSLVFVLTNRYETEFHHCIRPLNVNSLGILQDSETN